MATLHRSAVDPATLALVFRHGVRLCKIALGGVNGRREQWPHPTAIARGRPFNWRSANSQALYPVCGRHGNMRLEEYLIRANWPGNRFSPKLISVMAQSNGQIPTILGTRFLRVSREREREGETFVSATNICSPSLSVPIKDKGHRWPESSSSSSSSSFSNRTNPTFDGYWSPTIFHLFIIWCFFFLSTSKESCSPPPSLPLNSSKANHPWSRIG